MLELRIVLVLIGVLLVIPITSFAAIRKGGSNVSARASLRGAVAQAEMHRLRQGTYVGLTPAELETGTGRRGRRPRYTITNLSSKTFCIAATSGGQSWRKNGPAGQIVPGRCG